MSFCGFRQFRTNFLAEISLVHGTFTCSVYVRVQPCTSSVYQAVHKLPAKTTAKGPEFRHLTCAMAPKNRLSQAFLVACGNFKKR